MQYCPECGAGLHERWAVACEACGANLTPYHAARTGGSADGQGGSGDQPRQVASSGASPGGSRTGPGSGNAAGGHPSGSPDTTRRQDNSTDTRRTPNGTPVTAGNRRATGGEPSTNEATGARDGLTAGDLRLVLPFERGAVVGGATVLGAYLLTYLAFVADRLVRGGSGLAAFGPTNATALAIGGTDVEVTVWQLVGWLLYGGMNVPLVATDGATVALFGLPAVSGAVTPLLYAVVVALATVAAGVAVAAASLPRDRRPTTVAAAGSGATVALGVVPVLLVGTLVVEASNVGPALGATAAYAAGFAAVGGALGGLLARTLGLAGG